MILGNRNYVTSGALSWFLGIIQISTTWDCSWWHSHHLLWWQIDLDDLAPSWLPQVLLVCPFRPRSVLPPTSGLDCPLYHLYSVVTLEVVKVSLKALSCQVLSNTKDVKISGLLLCHMAAKGDSQMTSPAHS